MIYSDRALCSFSASEVTLIVTGTTFSTTPAPHLSQRLFVRLSHPAENEPIYLPDGSLPNFLFMTAQ